MIQQRGVPVDITKIIIKEINVYKHQNEGGYAVSYTHLDVYKRQNKYRYTIKTIE